MTNGNREERHEAIEAVIHTSIQTNRSQTQGPKNTERMIKNKERN